MQYIVIFTAVKIDTDKKGDFLSFAHKYRLWVLV